LKLSEGKIVGKGFISIEKVEGYNYLVHRSFSGQIYFKGYILANLSKIKEILVKNDDRFYSAKVTVYVQN